MFVCFELLMTHDGVPFKMVLYYTLLIFCNQQGLYMSAFATCCLCDV